jgi:hypothetical protein
MGTGQSCRLLIPTGIFARLPAAWNACTLAVKTAEATAYTANLSDGTVSVIELKTPRVTSVYPDRQIRVRRDRQPPSPDSMPSWWSICPRRKSWPRCP